MSASVVDGLPFAEDKKKYILDVLDPILEEMVSDVLTDMPPKPLDHMVRWLRKRNGGAPSTKMSIQAKNAMLENELKQITGSLEEAGTAISGNPKEDEEEEEEEEEDDELDEIPDRMDDQKMGRARQSVSAEAYGQWNKKQAYTAPVIAKSEEQKDRLSKTLQKSFMFSNLEPADMETIIMAMNEVDLEKGKQVITEGEAGDYLFVIEKGSLECVKKVENKDTVVKTCVAGDVFGELALLYNQKRAASVIAKEDSVCWQLDRESFNHIVRDAAVKKRNKYDAFLQKVTLLQSIDAYQRSQVADALKMEMYQKGDVIVRQGEPGDRFYIIEDGTLYATKTTPIDGEKRVMDYKSGDYFGELALLKNQPRAASVIVSSETAKVLSMTRQSFNKMLGPLQQLLEKKVASYT